MSRARRLVHLQHRRRHRVVPRKVFDWKREYDPAGASRRGTITAKLGQESVTLRDGDQVRDATFDRFGLFTTNRGGSDVKIYFDGLQYTAARP